MENAIPHPPPQAALLTPTRCLATPSLFIAGERMDTKVWTAPGNPPRQRKTTQNFRAY